MSAEYTELEYTYDSTADAILVSGTLKVYSNVAGTVTAEWGYDQWLVKVTGQVTENFVALKFEEVPFFELDYATVTFVSDAQDTSIVETHVSESVPMFRVDALGPFDASINENASVSTRINGFDTDYLYLFPGTKVTVKMNVQFGDSYTVEPFYIDGEEAVAYEDDGKGTVTFTVPETNNNIYLSDLFEHDATKCTDADGDHLCDSDICDEKSTTVDENNDNVCDICNVGLIQLGTQKYCDLDELFLNQAEDGDVVKLHADHIVAGEEGRSNFIWFEPEESITVTLDLNGYTLSVLKYDYLIGISENGTLRIIDSSENKTGTVTNPSGDAVIELTGGILDLRDFHNPEGNTQKFRCSRQE